MRVKDLSFWIATISIVILVGVAVAATSFESRVAASSEYHGDATLFNDELKVAYANESVCIGNYTDDTHEPTGWELLPSIFWDSNGNGVFETNESIAHSISPCVHFTISGQSRHFWPLHQSIMQNPGDPEIISSGWMTYPTVYRSKVRDASRSITLECTITLDGNNDFKQEINVTSTADSTLMDVNLIVYVGFDINGPFNDYAFIDPAHNNMLKACDNETGIWFGAYPSLRASSFEVSEWNDGPGQGDDLWQHTLSNALDGATVSSGDTEGALGFNLGEISPGQSRSTTIYYLLGNSENDLRFHDVSITGVAPSASSVAQGATLSVNITAENPGYYNENFSVTLYADQNTTTIGDEYAIGTQTVYNLASGASATIAFTWNTYTFPLGIYTVSARAPPAPDEIDTNNNMLIDGTVIIQLLGGGGGCKMPYIT
jgi:hypothetical protein